MVGSGCRRSSAAKCGEQDNGGHRASDRTYPAGFSQVPRGAQQPEREEATVSRLRESG